MLSAARVWNRRWAITLLLLAGLVLPASEAWAVGGGQWDVAVSGTTCFNLLVDTPVQGPRLLSSRQPLQDSVAERDLVFADAAGLMAGTRMQVVRNVGPLKHPATNATVGEVLKILGVVEVIDADDQTTLLRVVGSCREFEVGDYLRPLPDDADDHSGDLPRFPVFNDEFIVTPAETDAFLVMGSLESVVSDTPEATRESVTSYGMYAQRDLVVIDQGANAAWEFADVALIYRDRIYTESDVFRAALVVPPVLGRGVVVRADASSAVVQIVDSVAEIQVGDRFRKVGSAWDYANNPPSISCRSERNQVRFGESVRLTAQVSDADGDETTVSWTASAGTLSAQEGNSVTWTAASFGAGAVSVVATVDDGRDDGMVDCNIALSTSPAPTAGATTTVGAGGAEVLSFTCPEFPAGNSVIDNRCKALLDEVALRLRQDPRGTVEIVGYSDSSGSVEINAATSLERADNARDYLVETHGIDAGRLTTSGAGSEMPIADNSTPEGRLSNRRLEIRLTLPGEEEGNGSLR